MASQRDPIYRAVLSSAVAFPSPKTAPTTTIVFLRIEKADPSPEFLASIQDTRFIVRPGSRGSSTGNAMHSDEYRDNETGEIGIGLNLGPIEWKGRNSAQVNAGGFVYVVKKEEHGWMLDYTGFYMN